VEKLRTIAQEAIGLYEDITLAGRLSGNRIQIGHV